MRRHSRISAPEILWIRLNASVEKKHLLKKERNPERWFHCQRKDCQQDKNYAHKDKDMWKHIGKPKWKPQSTKRLWKMEFSYRRPQRKNRSPVIAWDGYIQRNARWKNRRIAMSTLTEFCMAAAITWASYLKTCCAKKKPNKIKNRQVKTGKFLRKLAGFVITFSLYLRILLVC